MRGKGRRPKHSKSRCGRGEGSRAAGSGDASEGSVLSGSMASQWREYRVAVLDKCVQRGAVTGTAY